MDLINGKVAAIIDHSAVVINKGYRDGVEKDMKFIIYENGEEIFDPDTSESLGKLEYIKAHVIVKFPSEKNSLAETYLMNKIQGTASIASAISALSGQIPRYEKDTILIDESAKRLCSGPATLKVKIGDLVRQIVD